MSSDSTHEISYLKPDRLRQARERRGLTQRVLSELCGIGWNQINKYENGAGEPSVRILYLIAKELDVTTDYLLGLSDFPKGFEPEDITNEELKLLAAFKNGDSSTIVRLLTERLDQLDAEKKAD